MDIRFSRFRVPIGLPIGLPARLLAVLFFGLAMAGGAAAPARAQIIVAVNEFYDAPDFDVTDGIIDASAALPGNQITLRAAIMHANFNGGNWKILLAGGTYALSVVGNGENSAFAGDLDLNGITIEIQGTLLPPTRIDGALLGDRGFHVLNSTRATFKALEITNTAGVTGGGIRQESGTRVTLDGVLVSNCSATGAAGSDGGGILSFGDLTLTGNSAVQGCLADGSGGGINFQGPSLTIQNSSLYFNLAGGRGGGLNAPGTGSFASLTNCALGGNRSGLGLGGGSGGGIANRSTMTLTDCLLEANQTSAGASGGGIENRGALNLLRTEVRSNTASLGGGVLVAGLASATLIESTVSGNTGEIGGGCYNAGTLEVRDSTISGNVAVIPLGLGGGGGIYSFTTLYLVNSTISGNSGLGNFGGGLYNASGGYAEISSCTFHANSAADGASIYNGDIGFTPKVVLRNTILSNFGTGGANYGDPSGNGVASQGYNYDTDGTFYPWTPLDLSPAMGASPNPYLGALQFNGGPTMTHRVYYKSNAIATADPNGVFDHTGAILFADQRAFARPNVSLADIGAYEARCDPDMYPPGGDGFVEDFDFVEFAAAYDILLTGAGDFDGDDDTDDDDFVVFATAYNMLICP